ncbi:MAG: pyruvate dehydrogenase [Chloroflexi bacterium GWB2_49_20]|nr:MAG: pyruvate dehydrogenase [Chloroflexi bacterium GWB2_49_20]OGN78362.1 MAG: pyruvate dehydrogenase [Chloroflexi bacterium GWC2_49_37]OGN84174.1 MAG: pyruvate dehydrogenase [Chloroflexi bacterium GWD2_49_16]HBG75169.1 alpha-ketoacid dehydrogenase subunit beta [Anaerolineae bacterium]HCC79195.1 alpha-ketoacid dehydrogenase subunit beta [Anaerolineae bacterium]
MSDQKTREITYLEAVREAMVQEMRSDPDVFLMGEDIGVYGGAFGVSQGMLDEFGPERIRETPISEEAIAGAATGAAMMGMRPIIEIMFMDFLTLAMDQLANQAAKIRFMFGGQTSVPLVCRAPAGSGTGAAAQHCQSLEAWLVHAPGIKVVAPSTPYDAKGLLVTSIRDNNPVFFMEHKLLYRTKGQVPEDLYSIPFGQAEVKRPGRDLTVIAYSNMVVRALEAAEILAVENIEIEVVDLRTLKPLDEATLIASVCKTGRVLIVHEAPLTGGFGGELAALIAGGEAFDFLDAPIRRLAGLDIPIPYNRTLERATVPQVEDIVAAARILAKEGK